LISYEGKRNAAIAGFMAILQEEAVSGIFNIQTNDMDDATFKGHVIITFNTLMNFGLPANETDFDIILGMYNGAAGTQTLTARNILMDGILLAPFEATITKIVP